MYRRIILPAAGQGSRIGNIPKELLPISSTENILQRSYRIAKEFGEPVVITNPHKHYWHSIALPDARMLSNYSWKEGELWGSIKLGLIRDIAGGLILPDTYFEHNVKKEFIDQDFEIAFGLFDTDTPERFSTIDTTSPVFSINTKEKSNHTKAWGMLLWSAKTTNRLLDLFYTHYDRAFEHLEDTPVFFDIKNYQDLGTFDSYRNFLTKV